MCSTRISKKNSLLNSCGSIVSLVLIWLFAFFLSSPLIFFNRIETIDIDFDASMHLNEHGENKHFNASESKIERNKRMTSFKDSNDFTSININHCIENSPFLQSRLIYSYISFVIQYTLPILIVALAYGNIWWKLKKHRNNLKSHQKDSRLLQKRMLKGTEIYQSTTSNLLEANKKNTIEGSSSNALEKTLNQTNLDKKRRLKMNLLLIFIALIFAASWLPLNLFNILSDTKNSFFKADHTFYIINAVCILFAMSSAVSNPFLYGVLNENFKREYVKFFYQILNKFSNCCRNSGGQLRSSVIIEVNSFSKYDDSHNNRPDIPNKCNGSLSPKNNSIELKERSFSNIESGENNIKYVDEVL